mgnify:CR=1 FL=1
MNLKKIKGLSVNVFFPIYMMIYFVLMFGVRITNFIGIPLVILISLVAISYWIVQIKYPKNRNFGKRIGAAWAFYCIFSIYLYSVNALPLSCYIDGLRNFLFPLLFFFIGSNEDITDDTFYHYFLLSCLFFFGFGLYLYFYTPSYYLDFLIKSKEETWYLDSSYINESNVMQYTRFSSFMSTSYVTSALSVSMMACAYGYIYNRKYHISKNLLYVIVILGLVGAILSQQRIAMFCSVSLFIFYIFYGVKRNDRTSLYLVLGVLLLYSVGVGFSFLDERVSIITEMLTGRMENMSFSGAMSERTGQYSRAYSEILSYLITGKGLGAGGHSASLAGSVGIHDGEYLHLLLEFGLMGAVLFIPFMIRTIYRSIKNFKYLSIETCIVVYILLSGIGENVLSQSYFIGSIFWYCVGRVWSENYLKQRINESCK